MSHLLPGVPERAPLSSSSLASAWRNLLLAVAISFRGLPLRRDGTSPFHPGAPVLSCPQQGALSAPEQGGGLPGGHPLADESEATWTQTTFSVISLHHKKDLLAPSAYFGLPYALCSEPGDKEEGGSRDPRPPEDPTRAPPFWALPVRFPLLRILSLHIPPCLHFHSSLKYSLYTRFHWL